MNKFSNLSSLIYKIFFAITIFIILNYTLVFSQDTSSIVTGPDSKPKSFNQPSIDYSSYLNGSMSKEVQHTISNLKIIRFDYKDGNINLNVLPLDQFGNFIENFNSKQLDLEHSIIRDFIKVPSSITMLSESKLQQNKDFLSLHFLIENSSSTIEINKILEQLRLSFQSFYTGDLVSAKFFNHSSEQIFSNEAPESAFLKIITNSNSFGTNASAEVLINTLEEISSQKTNYKNIIIQIFSSSENSSLLKGYKEAINKAKEMGIPVYAIGIGTDIKTFQIQPLANGTGAKHYIIDYSNLEDLSKIINEIYFGNKVHYKFRIKPTDKIEELEDCELKISLYNGTTFVDEAVQIFFKTPEIFLINRIIAIFNSNESIPDSSFNNQTKKLAEYLRDNPNKKIQINGYSDNEVSDMQTSMALSLERATKIKEMILNEGVNPHRIRTKAYGNSSPIYYVPVNIGQSILNRRVELKWLDEDLLPFEIIGEKAISEFEAEKLIKKWESLGYKAYYKRTVEFDEIYYKIIFWGYKTENQVSSEIEKLKSTFDNIEFNME